MDIRFNEYKEAMLVTIKNFYYKPPPRFVVHKPSGKPGNTRYNYRNKTPFPHHRVEKPAGFRNEDLEAENKLLDEDDDLDNLSNSMNESQNGDDSGDRDSAKDKDKKTYNNQFPFPKMDT
jgi:hypothetical protein